MISDNMKYFLVISLVFLLHYSIAKTVTYSLEFTRGFVSPNGVSRASILVNGMFPGPAIEASVGDTVVVSITNHLLMQESIVIHWHGIEQRNTPWYDGAAFVTNCPIVFGSSFTYKFTVDSPGTFWYHAHLGTTVTEGSYGMFIVRATAANPDPFAYDAELNVILADWYDASVTTTGTGVINNPFIFPGVGNGVLINGHHSSSQLSVTAGKTYLIRILNAGSLAFFNFAIAGHTFKLVGVDGSYTSQVSLSSVDLTSGQRVSVLLTADNTPKNYTMQAQTDWRGLDVTSAGIGSGILSYDTASANEASSEVPPNESRLANTWNTDVTKSYTSGECPANDEVTKTFVLTLQQQYVDAGGFGFTPPIKLAGTAGSKMAWTLYRNAALVFPSTPYLLGNYFDVVRDSSGGYNTALYGGSAQPIRIEKNDIVDVIVQNSIAANGACEQHPWHLHGHDFWVVGEGVGEYESSSRSTFNTLNPVKRDTVAGYPTSNSKRRTEVFSAGTWMDPCGWVAVRFKADNPGFWLFHCHITWHMEMGMAVVFDEYSEKVTSSPPNDYPYCGAGVSLSRQTKTSSKKKTTFFTNRL